MTPVLCDRGVRGTLTPPAKEIPLVNLENYIENTAVKTAIPHRKGSRR